MAWDVLPWDVLSTISAKIIWPVHENQCLSHQQAGKAKV